MGFVRTIGFAVILSAFPVIAGCEAVTKMTQREGSEDAAISKAVKEKLLAEPAANLRRVNVETNDGAVVLSGLVSSLDARDRALKITWQVTGVKTVVDHLRVE
jgi:osmotically-inducible protein OsmY